MKVTDKDFFMEKFMIWFLDLILERTCKKRKLDAVIIVDGDEGFGKTGLSILLAYYLSCKSGREFNLDNIFFDPEEFIERINSTKKQIIVWDEAALGGLASNWQNKVQQMLIQTLMTCRFRQHIIIFNCPKFYRLNQYFVTDRSVGLMHVYSPDGIRAGRVVYYKKDYLERMLTMWQTKKMKPYKKFTKAIFRGGFVDAFNLDIINEDEYDEKKSYYTEKILTKFKGSGDKTKELSNIAYELSLRGLNPMEIAKMMGKSERTIERYLRKERVALSPPTPLIN
jgi:hypothetical protein